MARDLIQFEYEDKNIGFTKLEKVNLISQNSKELRNTLNRAKEKLVVQGSSDEVNRMALESKKVKIFVSNEKEREKDFMHFRNSGLNQVLCNLAKKNNIAIAFNFNDLLKASSWEQRSVTLGRIMQNIRLCRKAKVKMIFASFAKKEEDIRPYNMLLSFTKVLGMSTKESKEAFL
ncbi:hypothetical protein J4468_01615 [Candidatus Woesearchaeota archaeon]|nr:hypothetical protein [Candidatus Woesearchaeota archaeon]